jgi:hypothetical protein
MGKFAETAIVDNRLPSKENERPLFVSVRSIQTEIYRFHFPFAENKRKLPFHVSFVWRHGPGHGDMEMETRKNMVTWNMETWRHGNMETWKHGNIAT